MAAGVAALATTKRYSKRTTALNPGVGRIRQSRANIESVNGARFLNIRMFHAEDER
jgi:hypothetical protein